MRPPQSSCASASTGRCQQPHHQTVLIESAVMKFPYPPSSGKATGNAFAAIKAKTTPRSVRPPSFFRQRQSCPSVGIILFINKLYDPPESFSEHGSNGPGFAYAASIWLKTAWTMPGGELRPLLRARDRGDVVARVPSQPAQRAPLEPQFEAMIAGPGPVQRPRDIVCSAAAFSAPSEPVVAPAAAAVFSCGSGADAGWAGAGSAWAAAAPPRKLLNM